MPPRYRKSVLLIDDDGTDRLLFSRLLEKAGFKVIATGSAEHALTTIVAGEIGCVITDQLMPISGQELVSLIHGVRSDIGIIFLSGAETPRGSIPAGTSFVSKADTASLLNVVAKCMRHLQIE